MRRQTTSALPSARKASTALKLQPVTRVSAFAAAREGTDLDKVLQIPRSGRARCPGDRNIVLGAQTAIESIRPFAEHPLNRLGLPFVQLIAMPVIKMCLGDEEAHPLQGDLPERPLQTIRATM